MGFVVGAVMGTGVTRAFISAPAVHPTPTPAVNKLPAILSAATVTMPTVAHAAEATEGAVWIPALSAVGAGFAMAWLLLVLELGKESPQAVASMASVASRKLQMIFAVCCYFPWLSWSR